MTPTTKPPLIILPRPFPFPFALLLGLTNPVPARSAVLPNVTPKLATQLGVVKSVTGERVPPLPDLTPSALARDRHHFFGSLVKTPGGVGGPADDAEVADQVVGFVNAQSRAGRDWPGLDFDLDFEETSRARATVRVRFRCRLGTRFSRAGLEVVAALG